MFVHCAQTAEDINLSNQIKSRLMNM